MYSGHVRRDDSKYANATSGQPRHGGAAAGQQQQHAGSSHGLPTASNAPFMSPSAAAGLHHHGHMLQPSADIGVTRRRSLMSDFMHPPASSGAAGAGGFSPISVDVNQRRQMMVDRPQVENISPSSDEPSTASATTSSTIAEKLDGVEKKMKHVDSKIKALERKQRDIEESNKNEKENKQDAAENMGDTWIDKIYAENRKKAAQSHAEFEKIGYPDKYVVPMYVEPQDTEAWRIQEEKHKLFRPTLIKYITKMKQDQKRREKYLSDRYDVLHQEWEKKVVKWENKATTKAREQKYREVFEKTFVDLRKQREDKERSSRSESRTTPASFSLISHSASNSAISENATRLASVHIAVDQDDDMTKMRQQAVVPPIMYDERTQVRLRYNNTNGIVRQPMNDHQFRRELFLSTWTDEEIKLFKTKLASFWKNFAAIAFFFERKSTMDCVRYYYLTKKRCQYKNTIRGKGYRKRTKYYRPPIMPDEADLVAPSGLDEMLNAESASTPAVVKQDEEQHCGVCKIKMEATGSQGRGVLTRACYELYGLDPGGPNVADVRICNKCRMANVRKKQTSCPVGSCQTMRRKVKPTKPLPHKWKQLNPDQQAQLCETMEIPADCTKTCHSCFKRIGRQVELLLNGAQQAGQDEEEAEQSGRNDDEPDESGSNQSAAVRQSSTTESVSEQTAAVDDSSSSTAVPQPPPPATSNADAVWPPARLSQLQSLVKQQPALDSCDWAAVAARLDCTPDQCRQTYYMHYVQQTTATEAEAVLTETESTAGVAGGTSTVVTNTAKVLVAGIESEDDDTSDGGVEGDEQRAAAGNSVVVQLQQTDTTTRGTPDDHKAKPNEALTQSQAQGGVEKTEPKTEEVKEEPMDVIDEGSQQQQQPKPPSQQQQNDSVESAIRSHFAQSLSLKQQQQQQRKPSQSQDSVRSGDDSAATLSADDSDDAPTGKRMHADARPQAARGQLYKPKFHGPTAAEAAAAAAAAASQSQPPAVKQETTRPYKMETKSPDLQIIESVASASNFSMPPTASTPVSSVGSLTLGTPLHKPAAVSSAPLLPPGSTAAASSSSSSAALAAATVSCHSRGSSRPPSTDVTAAMIRSAYNQAHQRAQQQQQQQQQQPAESHSRGTASASPAQQQQQQLLTASQEVQAAAQLLANQEYVRAKQRGLNDAQALHVYQTALAQAHALLMSDKHRQMQLQHEQQRMAAAAVQQRLLDEQNRQMLQAVDRQQQQQMALALAQLEQHNKHKTNAQRSQQQQQQQQLLQMAAVAAAAQQQQQHQQQAELMQQQQLLKLASEQGLLVPRHQQVMSRSPALTPTSSRIPQQQPPHAVNTTPSPSVIVSQDSAMRANTPGGTQLMTKAAMKQFPPVSTPVPSDHHQQHSRPHSVKQQQQQDNSAANWLNELIQRNIGMQQQQQVDASSAIAVSSAASSSANIMSHIDQVINSQVHQQQQPPQQQPTPASTFSAYDIEPVSPDDGENMSTGTAPQMGNRDTACTPGAASVSSDSRSVGPPSSSAAPVTVYNVFSLPLDALPPPQQTHATNFSMPKEGSGGMVSLQKHIPSDAELSVPHEISLSIPAFKAASVRMAQACDDQCKEFMLCREEEQDPRRCLKEGAAVTACGVRFLQQLKRSPCRGLFEQYAACIDDSPGGLTQAGNCAASRYDFNLCVEEHLGLPRVNVGDASKHKVHHTSRPKPVEFRDYDKEAAGAMQEMPANVEMSKNPRMFREEAFKDWTKNF